MTLKEARDRRYQARKLLDDYIDPSEHRQAILARIRTSAANTLLDDRNEVIFSGKI